MRVMASSSPICRNAAGVRGGLGPAAGSGRAVSWAGNSRLSASPPRLAAAPTNSRRVMWVIGLNFIPAGVVPHAEHDNSVAKHAMWPRYWKNTSLHTGHSRTRSPAMPMQIPWRLNLALALAVVGLYAACYSGVSLLAAHQTRL